MAALQKAAFALVATAALASGTVLAPGGASAAGIAFSTQDVGAFGGEPSIISDNNGVLYDTTPSGPQTYRSSHGGPWSEIESPDNNSGDDCLAVDQSNALYWCNLASMTNGNLALQADVWKSTVASTCGINNCNWAVGQGVVGNGTCSTSCNPFGVDRQWTDASIAPGQTTSQAEVVLMYHDFYGPSQIWVNISHDGGATFGPPTDIFSGPNFSAGGVAGTVVAQGYTFCNTIPAGVRIVQPGLPHAGRIFVSWIAADLAQNATGCNISMLQSFHTLWVAYSDDNGVTWTPQQAFDIGVGHDASTPFVGFTLDDQGNPYIAFDANHWDPDAATNQANTAACAALATAGQVQTHPECEYDMYVVWSHDGGSTWDGGGGTVPGSAAAPYRVNPASETGTHFFPAIAAGDPGQVDVAYLRTDEILPTDPLGKADPGGCAGPGPGNGNPTTYPPACSWNLYGAQSLDLLSPPATATWVTTAITSTPMHVGDICNLGIACVAPTSNRNLLDFIQETIDPTTGCAHIGYADDNTLNKMRSADQTTGCLTLTSVSGGAVPESPWAALFIPGGVAVALGVSILGRRRRTARAF